MTGSMQFKRHLVIPKLMLSKRVSRGTLLRTDWTLKTRMDYVHGLDVRAKVLLGSGNLWTVAALKKVGVQRDNFA